MTRPPPTDPGDEVLRTLVRDGGRDLRPCVGAFSPLLFALAAHCQVAQPEDAVYRALAELRRRAPYWEASGLPARLWVAGVARRCFDELRRAESGPAEVAVQHAAAPAQRHTGRVSPPLAAALNKS